MHRRLFYVVALLAIFLSLGLRQTKAEADLSPQHFSASQPQPSLYLWAWERREDLRFVSAQPATGVAFLAQTIYLRDSGVLLRPRMQPLRVNAGTRLMAVVRIESAPGAAERLDKNAWARVVDEVVAATQLAGVSALQVDFDARRSELAFYKDLLSNIRQRMPRTMPLSITALTSWCLENDWISTLPINDAVPMMFRMSADAGYVRRYFAAYGDFPAAICNHSIGLSTDEPQAKYSGRQLYLFAPTPWTAQLLEAQKGVQQ